jgi:MFS family permease
VNNASVIALVFAAGLVLLGVLTATWQVRGLRALAERKHVPSDEYDYFRGRYRRRLVTAALLMSIGAMIGGAYLSGMAQATEQLGQPRDGEDDQPKPEMTDDQKEFVRFLTAYWSVVLVLVFALVGLATVDAFATRRFWLAQYRALRDDHQTRLRRDLAVYKQHREQTRGRGTNRLGEAGEG